MEDDLAVDKAAELDEAGAKDQDFKAGKKQKSATD